MKLENLNFNLYKIFSIKNKLLQKEKRINISLNFKSLNKLLINNNIKKFKNDCS